MPQYIVTLKDGASKAEIEESKKHAIEQGGEVTHEYNIFPGFAVKFPKDSVSTLESAPHVSSVELDQEVKTQ
ncbi:putative peptidase inhibitor i9 protein [Coleophoma cylindrospora]|uniref:Putative peptidase inhibitor i9 protein n=1 Tax=Coleophoma cylindrospora TaxID=1849047 RepID=A0A3D8R5A9_9HELO|nr:putative peptidase inhibitor i9 protein [Coleophoma cylindrospora]